MNGARSIESWRIVRVWPSAPRITSWWATRPGRRTEWIGIPGWVGPDTPVASDLSLAGRDAAPMGVSSCVVMQLDDLRLVHAWRPRRRSASSTPPRSRRAPPARWRGLTGLRRDRTRPAQLTGRSPSPITTDRGLDATSAFSSATSGRGVGHHVGVAEHLGKGDAERRVGATGEPHVLRALHGSADDLPMRPAAPDTATRIMPPPPPAAPAPRAGRPRRVRSPQPRVLALRRGRRRARAGP